jgi:DNA-binding Xre family transcriptional regulator
MNELEKTLKEKKVASGKATMVDFLKQDVGISFPTYYAMMSKSHGYSTETIDKIAKYLNVKSSDVIAMLEKEV